MITSDAIEARLSLAELVAEFDMGKVSRGAPKFDPEELKRLFRYLETPNFPPRYNVAPTDDALVVVQREDRRAITAYRWGLIRPATPRYCG